MMSADLPVDFNFYWKKCQACGDPGGICESGGLLPNPDKPELIIENGKWKISSI